MRRQFCLQFYHLLLLVSVIFENKINSFSCQKPVKVWYNAAGAIFGWLHWSNAFDFYQFRATADNCSVSCQPVLFISDISRSVPRRQSY